MSYDCKPCVLKGNIANHLGKTLAHIVSSANSFREVPTAKTIQTLSTISRQHDRIFLTKNNASKSRFYGS